MKIIRDTNVFMLLSLTRCQKCGATFSGTQCAICKTLVPWWKKTLPKINRDKGKKDE